MDNDSDRESDQESDDEEDEDNKEEPKRKVPPLQIDADSEVSLFDLVGFCGGYTSCLYFQIKVLININVWVGWMPV